tara:strand:- start:523 stop:813 length:291 start_codon:yes stop_codon:yes gene_type:complete
MLTLLNVRICHILKLFPILTLLISASVKAGSLLQNNQSIINPTPYQHNAAIFINAIDYKGKWPSLSTENNSNVHRLANLLGSQGFDFIETSNPDSH